VVQRSDSWLQIQRLRFDSRRYQIFREVVGLERAPLSFVSAIEELLERKSSGCGLEIREYGRWDPSRWPRGTLYPQKLALTSQTSGGRWVGKVRSRTEAFFFLRQSRVTLLYLKPHWQAIHQFDSTISSGMRNVIHCTDSSDSPLLWTTQCLRKRRHSARDKLSSYLL
jgi:hypothetical protein